MNGGYLMVSKTDTKLYEKLNNALTIGKPVLWYEDENTCYYIDTITKSGTDIILTKGGKIITIESDGDITESGDVENPTLETIKDKDGNLRFIEGDGVDIPEEGKTLTYCRWSLSGTHLLLVCSGTFADTTAHSIGDIAEYDVPKWILDKIIPVINENIIYGTAIFYATNNTTQSTPIILVKDDNKLKIRLGSLTFNTDRYFRFQFDLLIDNE